MPPTVEQVSLYRSELAQKLIEWEGRAFSLENYPMHIAIYDGSFKRTLLKCARQVAKSLTAAAFQTSECIGADFFKSYYISPTQEQTRKYSHTRVGKILNYSTLIRKNYVDTSEINNVLLRMMKNGSEMAFTYAEDDPDRARGYSADRCIFDEIQDMLYEPVVPVIESCMDNSLKGAYSMYAGTPKGVENTIEFLWSVSTQSEWVMRCDGCRSQTYVDTVKPLGKVGPECLKCRKPLNPRLGYWVDMNPGAGIKGFHISRPIMPENVPAAWNSETEKQVAQKLWEERILMKMDSPPPIGYGEIKFTNEVLGVSTASGERLLTEPLLKSLCENYSISRLATPEVMKGIKRTFAGVDWSGGGAEIKGSEGDIKSRTIIHIWGETATGKLKTLFYKIFPSGHCTGWVPEIVEIFRSYGCAMGCGDAGEGQLANALLRDALGANRWIQVRYMAMSSPIKWNPDNLSYHADRTSLIDNYAMFLKKRGAIFANEAAMRPAISDILNVYEETTTMGRKVWRHAPTQPDDALHAQLFGWIAWKLINKDMSFYA